MRATAEFNGRVVRDMERAEAFLADYEFESEARDTQADMTRQMAELSRLGPGLFNTFKFNPGV